MAKKEVACGLTLLSWGLPTVSSVQMKGILLFAGKRVEGEGGWSYLPTCTSTGPLQMCGWPENIRALKVRGGIWV